MSWTWHLLPEITCLRWLCFLRLIGCLFRLKEQPLFSCLIKTLMLVLAWSWTSIYISNWLKLSLCSRSKSVCIAFLTVGLRVSALFYLSRLLKGPWPRILIRINLKPYRTSPKSFLIIEFENNCFIFRWDGRSHGFIRSSLCWALV